MGETRPAPQGLTLRPLLGGYQDRVEAIAVTDVPRFVANQVVVQIAIGRECFEADGTTLRSEPVERGTATTPHEQIGLAVEEAMRALKASRPD